jgi:hypothetical protein
VDDVTTADRLSGRAVVGDAWSAGRTREFLMGKLGIPIVLTALTLLRVAREVNVVLDIEGRLSP